MRNYLHLLFIFFLTNICFSATPMVIDGRFEENLLPCAISEHVQHPEFIGEVTLSYKLWKLLGEPVHDYKVMWDWPDLNDVQYNEYYIMSLAKYPDLFDRFVNIKPLYLEFIAQVEYVGSDLAPNEKFAYPILHIIPDLIEKAGIPQKLSAPGSPKWWNLFVPYNEFAFGDYPDWDDATKIENTIRNKAYINSSDKTFLSNLKIWRLEWPEFQIASLFREYVKREKRIIADNVPADEFWNSPEDNATLAEYEATRKELALLEEHDKDALKYQLETATILLQKSEEYSKLLAEYNRENEKKRQEELRKNKQEKQKILEEQRKKEQEQAAKRASSNPLVGKWVDSSGNNWWIFNSDGTGKFVRNSINNQPGLQTSYLDWEADESQNVLTYTINRAKLEGSYYDYDKSARNGPHNVPFTLRGDAFSIGGKTYYKD